MNRYVNVTMFDFNYLIFILVGLIVGLLVGISGMGGGALMTPLLILLGINYFIAIGTSLVYMAITKTFGTILHHKKGHVNIKLGLILLKNMGSRLLNH